MELYVRTPCASRCPEVHGKPRRIAHVNICPNSCSQNRNGKTLFRVTCSHTWRVLLQSPSRPLLAATYTMLPALVTCSAMSFTRPSKLLCTSACDARHSAYVMWNTDVRYMPLPNCNRNLRRPRSRDGRCIESTFAPGLKHRRRAAPQKQFANGRLTIRSPRTSSSAAAIPGINSTIYLLGRWRNAS